MALVALDVRAAQIGDRCDLGRLRGQPAGELAQDRLDANHRGGPQREAHLLDVALERRPQPRRDRRPLAARELRTCPGGVCAAGCRSRRRGTASPRRRATSSSAAARALDGRDAAGGSRRSAARDRYRAAPWSAAPARRRQRRDLRDRPPLQLRPTWDRTPARPRPAGTVRGTRGRCRLRPSRPEACSRPDSRPSDARGR